MHGPARPREAFLLVAVSAAAVALLPLPSVHFSSPPASLAAAYLKAPAQPAVQAPPVPDAFAAYRARVRPSFAVPVPSPSAPAPRVSNDVAAAQPVSSPVLTTAAPAPAPAVSTVPAATPYPSYSDAPSQAAQQPSYGSPQAYAESVVGAGQFACLNELWDRESGWNAYADNPSSGAYGIPQALPGSKMAAAGADWATNPITQVKWGIFQYIDPVYGSPCGAWAHEEETGWY